MSKRQEYNKKILEKVSDAPWMTSKLKNKIQDLIDKYPDQRWGQIFVNYIWSEFYEQGTPEKVIEIQDYFGWTYDPFFEESKETYNNVCEKCIEGTDERLREQIQTIYYLVDALRMELKKRPEIYRDGADKAAIKLADHACELISKIRRGEA